MLALDPAECKAGAEAGDGGRSGERRQARRPSPRYPPRRSHAGQHVEEAAADREDVLLERLAGEALLHGQEAVARGSTGTR